MTPIKAIIVEVGVGVYRIDIAEHLMNNLLVFIL